MLNIQNENSRIITTSQGGRPCHGAWAPTGRRILYSIDATSRSSPDSGCPPNGTDEGINALVGFKWARRYGFPHWMTRVDKDPRGLRKPATQAPYQGSAEPRCRASGAQQLPVQREDHQHLRPGSLGAYGSDGAGRPPGVGEAGGATAWFDPLVVEIDHDPSRMLARVRTPRLAACLVVAAGTAGDRDVCHRLVIHGAGQC